MSQVVWALAVWRVQGPASHPVSFPFLMTQNQYDVLTDFCFAMFQADDQGQHYQGEMNPLLRSNPR